MGRTINGDGYYCGYQQRYSLQVLRMMMMVFRMMMMVLAAGYWEE